MDDDTFREEIARLEARIELLTAARERCRKFALAARVAIAAGLAWIILLALSLVPASPATMLAALAAAIGGTVLLGSNKTTWAQTEAAIDEAEALRVRLIERLDLRQVGTASTMLH